jgi:hypothetical protein
VKKTKSRTPRPPSKISVLRQLCNLIPNHLVPRLARECGVEEFCRTFTAWSHVVAMLYAQLTHSIGLNDVCDSLGLHSGGLSAIRGAKAPARNTLSHAGKVRPALLAEKLFWATLAHLQGLAPEFSQGRRGRGVTRRFRKTIHLVDSTVIELVANSLDWAKHRRRKAAAKCHMRLDLHSLLPRFAIIDTARDNDAKRARELCASIQAGEIVIFDRAYLDFDHLFDLFLRGVSWVTRTKTNLQFRVLKRRKVPAGSRILADEEVVLRRKDAFFAKYPERMRRVRALVVVDGAEREMEFLTNSMEWAASSVADLYRARWDIEVFFKQIKQTLKLADFLGHSANAVRWQVWSALLVYLLLRFQGFLSSWAHSFTRLFAIVRAALWLKLDLAHLLQASYGTAGGCFRALATPQQAYFPAFAR